ncbi:hypothetical protein DK847_14780 [Aestuariivirga litoralis]|uniref:Uncharacterized protein n=1 Tax=Aestuariivirga litoralis TaxID=2650924 RepID=A0A2W2B788_9HYPH|nr:hypothetical protein [Aestuariivirga litoralis]PZF75918.1 hypothetical protein DK847_14780 [Aestuariivirga litoralis]
MLRSALKWCFLFYSCSAVTASAQTADAYKTGGDWVRIHMNDFKGMIYQGVSKHQVCTSEAKKLAAQFISQGRKVRTRILTEEIAVFEVMDGDRILIYCNPAGALFADMLLPNTMSGTMKEANSLGSEQTREDNSRTTKTTYDPVSRTSTTTETGPRDPSAPEQPPRKPPQQQ